MIFFFRRTPLFGVTQPGTQPGGHCAIEHVSIFPASFLSNYLGEPIFIVDDLNFLMLIKLLWIVACRGNKTIDLVSKKSTFCLECFLEDYKDRNKKLNEWRKVSEMLQR